MIDITKIETINIGIVGHIDHGKTTLLQKLSGKWADTHSEELKRGITIKLGYADTIIYEDEEGNFSLDSSHGKPKRYVTFVDAPGHEMLMATMLSGAAIMDGAILVVAADEGIKPQTKEHLIALKAKKIKNILVVQNKIDLVSRERALESYNEIKNFLKGTVAENSPVIPISAQQGINLEIVLEELCKMKIEERSLDSNPVFLVARSFDINKPGTQLKDLHGGVLGGALKKGKLKVGDKIEIKPGYSYKKQNQIYYKPITSKIISMHRGNYSILEATPGGSLAIETELEPSLTKADALSGSVASVEGGLPEITEKITIKYELFMELIGSSESATVSGLKANELLMLSLNTSTSVGQVVKVKGNLCELSLKIPVVPLKGDSIGIARNVNGHWRLIGFGEII